MHHLKSFVAERLSSILVNFRCLRVGLLKYREKKTMGKFTSTTFCTFDHDFRNVPLCMVRKVSFEGYCFVLYDCALISEILKMALESFCDETLHLFFTENKLRCTMCYNYTSINTVVYSLDLL